MPHVPRKGRDKIKSDLSSSCKKREQSESDMMSCREEDLMSCGKRELASLKPSARQHRESFPSLAEVCTGGRQNKTKKKQRELAERQLQDEKRTIEQQKNENERLRQFQGFVGQRDGSSGAVFYDADGSRDHDARKHMQKSLKEALKERQIMKAAPTEYEETERLNVYFNPSRNRWFIGRCKEYGTDE